MLPEEVLQDLTRRTPAGMMVLATAWPSLSTETKLEILQHFQSGFWNDAPEDVILIAGRDPEPIVRYWATRYWTLPDREAEARAKAWLPALPGSSDEAHALAGELLRDPAPLVAIAATVPKGLLSVPTNESSQSVRQLFLLNSRGGNVGMAVNWLEQLNDQALASPEELRDLVWEFMQSKWFLTRISQDKAHHDGMTHYDTVQAGKRLWDLTRKLPLAAAMMIAERAPVVVEEENVVVKIFRDLPKNLQELIIWRDDPGIDAIYKLVLEDPLLKASLADALDRKEKLEAEFGGRHEQSIASTSDKTALMACAISELTEEVKELRAQVAEATAKKRGFFG